MIFFLKISHFFPHQSIKIMFSIVHLLSWFWFSGSCKLAMVGAKKWAKSVITYNYIAVWDRNRSSSGPTDRPKCFPNRSCQEGLKTTQHPSSDAAEALVSQTRLYSFLICSDVSKLENRASIKCKPKFSSIGITIGYKIQSYFFEKWQIWTKNYRKCQ